MKIIYGDNESSSSIDHTALVAVFVHI